MWAPRAVAWGAAGAAVVALAGGCVLAALAGAHGDGPATTAVYVAVALASTLTGAALAARLPRNAVGWLLLANGLVFASFGLVDAWVAYAVLDAPGALPGGRWAVLYSERAWPLLFVPVTAIAWLFPDGRLPGPRWRPYAVAAAAAFGALVAISPFQAERYSAEVADVASPLPQWAWLEVPSMLALLGALAAMIGGVLAVRIRLRRATGIERQQLRWFACAAALVPATVVVCVAEIAATGEQGVALDVTLGAALTAIPLAIGVAVLRYRLYALDRLINRSLVYLALTGGLALVFAAVSLLLGVAIGSGSTVPTAGATLAVAVLFGPLRARMQSLVDRRFNRARYDGLRTVEAFLERLRTGRAAPEDTGAMLAEALGDPGLELRFPLPGEAVLVDPAGRLVADDPGAGRAETPVRRGGFDVAIVVHDPALGERPDVLESVIAAAGLAIEIARLRVEVRRQLAEVEASRTRIVTAGYEERRRLERDLHDGAQQQLVSIGLGLRHLQGQLTAGSPQAHALDATVGELSAAIGQLRELARGVRPAGLDDGLARALRELAARSRLRMSVDVTEERFDDRIETAAYFVASEALANAAKYAPASSVAVSALRRNGSLVVSVRDDGTGGAAPSAGSGLAGMADRVAALGGRVTVASPPGEGTVVTAELPCVS
jgi:signal transduction histidine kinase